MDDLLEEAERLKFTFRMEHLTTSIFNQLGSLGYKPDMLQSLGVGMGIQSKGPLFERASLLDMIQRVGLKAFHVPAALTEFLPTTIEQGQPTPIIVIETPEDGLMYFYAPFHDSEYAYFTMDRLLKLSDSERDRIAKLMREAAEATEEMRQQADDFFAPRTASFFD